jgi:hypothetical protein
MKLGCPVACHYFPLRIGSLDMQTAIYRAWLCMETVSSCDNAFLSTDQAIA